MLKINKPAVGALVVLGLVGGSVMAGTSDPEFGNLFNKLNTWATGYLGKALSIAAFILGAGMGIAKSTVMPAIMGLVFALMFSVGPGIISSTVSAVI
jgi:conjugal transfer pilus assembly protein TraA